jgi:hypothetical protein
VKITFFFFPLFLSPKKNVVVNKILASAMRPTDPEHCLEDDETNRKQRPR